MSYIGFAKLKIQHTHAWAPAKNYISCRFGTFSNTLTLISRIFVCFYKNIAFSLIK